MKIEKIYSQINVQNFTCADIFDSKKRKVASYLDCESPAVLIDKIKRTMVDLNSGMYEFKMKEKRNSHVFNEFDCNYINPEEQEEIEQHRQSKNVVLNSSVESQKLSHKDIEELEKRITERIKREHEFEQEKLNFHNSKKELEEKHKDLETWGGRLSLMIEYAIPKVLEKFAPQFAPILNGLKDVNVNQQNEMAEQQVKTEFSAEEVEMSNQALYIFLSIYSPSDLLKIATELKGNEMYQSLIKSQLLK
jgi:hypothetical protein